MFLIISCLINNKQENKTVCNMYVTPQVVFVAFFSCLNLFFHFFTLDQKCLKRDVIHLINILT